MAMAASGSAQQPLADDFRLIVPDLRGHGGLAR
jgi:pimeloyl-ACP methyl ester carboxylesterase